MLSERKDRELDNITYELLTKGREIADHWETKLAVLIVGNRLEPLPEALKNAGADVVLVADHPILHDYNTEVYCRVISKAVEDFKPSLFLLGHTYLGIEVGPAVAEKLGGAIVSNCVDLEVSNGEITATRPMYGETVLTKVEVWGATPYVVSFQKGVLPKKESSLKSASVVSIPVEVDESTIRSRIIGLVQPAAGEIDISKADIIIGVGRGVADKTKIQVVKELADALGGTIACSRPVADMGWLPIEYQVGISGKTVTPMVYIACGISGASQHVAGMRDSSLIIAINKDPNAPIFSVAHYGVVGDLFEIIPALTQEARKPS